ncbi:MAG TPA: hypothetical protein VFX98_14815 [Longimicrobiaceae bacterium]|nr:hypothetical protein [Longimicrobiaceae bacterium]
MYRRRSSLCTLLLATAAAAFAAGCTDESPTLGGEIFFPGGQRPVTLEAVFDAADFFELLGSFTNYARPQDLGGFYFLAANDFDGVLDASSLLRFDPPPRNVTYVQGNTTRDDTIYTFASSRLVVRVDSLATASAGPVTLELYRLAQNFDAATVTWELAVDSAGEHTPWTQPGGTRGVKLGEGVYNPATPGDSVVIALDSLETASVVDTSAANFGVVLVAREAGSRVQFPGTGVVLRAGVHPVSASPDTVVVTDIGLAEARSSFVFTPEPPQPAGLVQAGGIRAARTLFRLDLDQRVPACEDPQSPACPLVPLSQVSLNRVSLLLRPVDVPGGFAPLDSLPLSVRTIAEPGLGRQAPLGEIVVDPPNSLSPPFAFQVPGDTLVEVPLTALAGRVARGDTLPTTFALLSEPSAITFGLGLFEATPRLRIVYTLPVRPPLP